MEANRSAQPGQRDNAITKINQSTQLQNALAPFRKHGVNVVSSPDGIIMIGTAVGIVLKREAKNRYHVTALSSDVRIRTLDKPNLPNIGEALLLCAQLINTDKIISRKG